MLSATFSHFHVFGDFNIPDADWNAPCSVNVNTPMAIISNVITMFALMQVNHVLNHRGVLLDLILNSSLDVHVQRDQCPLLIEDAHHPSLNCLVPIPAPAALTFNLAPNPAKCNLRTLDDDLCTFDFASLDAIHDINESFWVLIDTISKSVLKHSPLKKWGFSNFPAWFSRDLKNLLFLKKALHKEYKSTRCEVTYQRFAVIRAQCNALTKDCFTAYADHIQEVLPHNPKVFWSYVKNLNRSGSTPTTLRLDGITSTSDQTAANLFADFFSAAFNHDDDVADDPPSTPPSFALISSIVLNVPEVRQALLSLDDSKGCGPDFIPSSAIKHICNLLAYPLTKLFNRSLFTGVFPDALKKSFIVPIHKKGPTDDIKNYRPIAILPVLAKVFEGLVLSRVNFAVSQIITPRQHGFWRGRSSATNLMVFQSDIIDALNVTSRWMSSSLTSLKLLTALTIAYL
ncbi:uncharacterized protein LOC124355600 [Homalodisca vitripennis]|uniref:uncharacterized protein LOC124355600 n=1 Tax=Homalodisca vitripennis TaxID=197043 RepID=UPI001EE9F56D|nr:uncharacterized protein LOC124355600 [Homalodisca vitripennis]